MLTLKFISYWRIAIASYSFNLYKINILKSLVSYWCLPIFFKVQIQIIFFSSVASLNNIVIATMYSFLMPVFGWYKLIKFSQWPWGLSIMIASVLNIRKPRLRDPPFCRHTPIWWGSLYLSTRPCCLQLKKFRCKSCFPFFVPQV